MRPMDGAQPKFARHETFHARYGWFRKACTLGSKDSRVFTRDDAPVVVGVGKTMVRVIRFRGASAKLIKVDPKSPSKRFSRYAPTEVGLAPFGDNGWDSYMEDPGTLWLLHWLLLESPSQLPAWWLAFNEFHPVEFSDSDPEETVTHQLESSADWPLLDRSSIKKDISVQLRTYAPTEGSSRAATDDVLDCPLRELILLGHSCVSGGYRITLGRTPTLPPSILGLAALKIHRSHQHSESDLMDVLAQVTKQIDSLELVAMTGAVQLTWSGEPRIIARQILSDYYSSPDLLGIAAGAQRVRNGLGGGE